MEHRQRKRKIHRKYRVNRQKMGRFIAILCCLVVFAAAGIVALSGGFKKGEVPEESAEPSVSGAAILQLSDIESEDTQLSAIETSEKYKLYITSPNTGNEAIDLALSSRVDTLTNRFISECDVEQQGRSELTIKYDLAKVMDKLYSVCFYITEKKFPLYETVESCESYIFDAQTGKAISNADIFTEEYNGFFNAKIAESVAEENGTSAEAYSNINFHASVLISDDSICLVYPQDTSEGRSLKKHFIPIAEAYNHITDEYKIFDVNEEDIPDENVDPIIDVEDDPFTNTADIPEGIDPTKPVIAFTFDDGPNGSTTKRIVDALKEHGARATFFIVGDRIGSEKQIDAMQYAVEAGCEIANHTWSHAKLTKLDREGIKEEIEKVNDALEDAIGIRTSLLRPPGGSTNEETLKAIKYPVIKWDVDTRDWESRDADAVVEQIKANVQDGSIILMHDLYKSTAEAVEKILPWLIEQGYQVVTVSELMQIKGVEMERGVVYYSAN
ncbi:MAG: polysaccharide deacetylase family protein [Christensenellaceae bacterium]|nr:polysaccharide deacetylase family protein [Christensenellaceae bacterium]